MFQNYLRTKGKKGNVVPVHTLKAYMKSRHIAPHILNLSTRKKTVDNFTSSLLYFEKRNQYPLNTRLGGTQSWSGLSGGEKNLLPLT
jgi:hypothetical protein